MPKGYSFGETWKWDDDCFNYNEDGNYIDGKDGKKWCNVFINLFIIVNSFEEVEFRGVNAIKEKIFSKQWKIQKV